MNIPLPMPDMGKYCIKFEIFGKPKDKKNLEKTISVGGTGTVKQTKNWA